MQQIWGILLQNKQDLIKPLLQCIPPSLAHEITTSFFLFPSRLPAPNLARIVSLWVLLLNIMLGSPLLRLPDIVSLLRRRLRLPITSQARNRTAHSARHPVRDAAGEIVELALCFLAFACSVLLLAFLLQ